MEFWIPLLAGFLGTVVGALASIGTVLVQSVNEGKRKRQELAVQLALEDFKVHNALAKTGDLQLPVGVYVSFYMDLLSAVHDDGTLSPEKLSEINDRSSKLGKGFASRRQA